MAAGRWAGLGIIKKALVPAASHFTWGRAAAAAAAAGFCRIAHRVRGSLPTPLIN